METVVKKAFDRDTGQYYMVAMPGPATVRQNILDLEYPEDGISVKDASIILAEKLNLSDEQKNARNSSNLNVFRYSVVAPQFKWLLEAGELEQPGGPRTLYFPAISSSDSSDSTLRETSPDPEPEWASSPESVKRTAVDPDTNEEYEVPLPPTSVVKKALLDFDYPASGIQIKDIAEALADQLELTDKQREAKNTYGLVWRFHVNITANDLVNSGQLLKLRRGWIINPEQPDVETPEDADGDSTFSDGDTQSPEAAMAQNFQKHEDGLKAELREKIMSSSPVFFEKLVLRLLVKMGYGRSLADAKVLGGSGDGGIDGIIKEDELGLSLIYIQAKRQEGNVSVSQVRDFTGALDCKGAQKGIFITTSDFTQPTKDFVEKVRSRRIILIDGDQLVERMIDHDLGVSLGIFYQLREVDPGYFSIDDEEINDE